MSRFMAAQAEAERLGLKHEERVKYLTDLIRDARR
jgi:hypothetical protein